MTGAPDRLSIPSQVVEGMLAHARLEVPNEACGVLSGSLAERRVFSFHPTRNSEDSPFRYNVHPEDLLRITLEIDDAGVDLIGIFHSHVASPGVPSETDRRLAFYPEAFYVLASLTDEANPDVRAWRIVDGDVTEAELTVDETPVT